MEQDVQKVVATGEKAASAIGKGLEQFGEWASQVGQPDEEETSSTLEPDGN